MLNLMKADVYRVFKGKAFWITLLVLLVFLVMNALTGTIGTMGMNNESLSNLMKTEPDLNGSLTQLYQMATADNLFYFFLPIIVAVITTDFVSGTARNVLAQGVSRTKYYLSKLLLVGLLSSTFIIIYETLPFAIATIKFGVGNYFDTFNFWRILLTQIPIYLAVISIGTLIALTF
ncbi:MAG: ABC transporter permease subunit, partial [Lachnospiraceae bacterium]|nr:ABC transporter permease subunit [Lachnospiraceae bacterium]